MIVGRFKNITWQLKRVKSIGFHYRYNYSTMNDLYLNGVLKWGKDISEDKAIVKGANSRDKLGYYGMRTKNAVIWFQREKGIKDDGEVRSETWTAMGLPEPKSALYYWMRDDWNSLDNGYNSFGKSPNSSYALFWATQHFSPKVESPTPKTTSVVQASQAPKVNNLITQSNQFNNIFNNNVNNIFMPEPIFKVPADQTSQVSNGNVQVQYTTTVQIPQVNNPIKGSNVLNSEEYDDQYDDLYDKNVGDPLRGSDAKKREKKQIEDAWGKDRAKREKQSEKLHDAKKGGRNDDNKSYGDLKTGNYIQNSNSNIGTWARIGLGVGGATIIIGTLVEDAGTGGGGILDDPATFSAGGGMIIKAFAR